MDSTQAQLGKTIRLYLVAGTPSGMRTVEIMNWTGKIVQAPRSQLGDLLHRDEAQKPGVYFLVGADPSEPNRTRVYVGESDVLAGRIPSHDQDESKDFYTDCVIVVSKDENLTKSHVRYLESRLITLIQQAGRASLANGNQTSLPQLPEADLSDMEYFLAQLLMILPVLGHGFARPVPSAVDEASGASPVFYMNPVGTLATAVEVDGEFVVQQGSTARKEGVDSWNTYSTLRDQLVEDGKLADSEDAGFYVFSENVPFKSPSAAASVVNAGNQNGRIVWKVRGTDQTYKEWQQGLVEQG